MCCCCGGDAKWKREIINDHKFDYVDVEEFVDRSCMTRFKYCFVFLFTLKSILVYVLDIYTAVMLVVFKTWTSNIQTPDKDSIQHLPYIRWIFVASIAASYILLFLEMKKTRAIILSRDISFTFTSIMANRFYTLRSYAHYCFFKQIHNQKRFKDELAFFIFFSLKGWKRLFFAEAPRQVVNGYILVMALLRGFDKLQQSSFSEKMSIVTMGVPCLLFIISAIRTMIAAFLYMFLVCEIQGNLKEYCCHKIDKRIAELLRNKARKRAYKDRIMNGAIHPTKPELDGFEDVIMMETVKRPVISAENAITDEKRAMPTRTMLPNYSAHPNGRLNNGQHPAAQPTLPKIDLPPDETNPYGPQGTGQVHGNRTSRFLASSLGRHEYMEFGNRANSECSDDSYSHYSTESRSQRIRSPNPGTHKAGQSAVRTQHSANQSVRSASPTRSEISYRSRPEYAPSANGRNLGALLDNDDEAPNRYQDNHHTPNHRSRSNNIRHVAVKPGGSGAINF
ncbi:hypothetical protein K493DRAFT_334787 [Basidiobolus meristosporus CBS 931.73]|uniref:Uncharacterized protein n=1 Tax=Basidiobolus meristosporus CBS 931.73 TaxID=1314790 RepID=A0A1Y1YVD9_9FUNG|nr:hypothetical protein K493DRAFT_334787 [Basidiobolus meristosporus CBS 931.73]|eukprot:ORY01939.1 hypothetical protein K493DRAFT_334787 [Basidiobolus meristosporus CBS 931.73]